MTESCPDRELPGCNRNKLEHGLWQLSWYTSLSSPDMGCILTCLSNLKHIIVLPFVSTSAFDDLNPIDTQKMALHTCSLLASISRMLDVFVAIANRASTLHSHVCKVIHATTGDWFFDCQAYQHGVSTIRLLAMQAL